MDTDIQLSLTELYKSSFGKTPNRMVELPPSGSYRRYFRMTTSNDSVIGAWNNDVKENNAFIGISRHFRNKGINVPAIYAEGDNKTSYIMEDLGDVTLMSYLNANGIENSLSMFKQTVDSLLRVQFEGGKGLDYSIAYPRAEFDKQSMLWDLYYFKYCFLKFLKVPFDEQFLEDDFNQFVNYLCQFDSSCFLYRDFKSPNVMIKDDEPWFIDYQGGRRGSFYYDIASLLFEAGDNLPFAFRDEVLDHYKGSLSSYIKVDDKEFYGGYYAFALIRMMQAMGAYGFRGLHERKPLFIRSIAPALSNVRWFVSNVKLSVYLPEIQKVLNRLCEVDPNTIE